MAATIITIAIEKGGTGKTVTASNLAYLMGDEGKRVLCIDTDPQGNLTKALSGGESITSESFYGKALYNLIDGFMYGTQTRNFIVESEYENVDFIPCDVQTPRINRRIEDLKEDSDHLKDDDPRKVSNIGAFLYHFLKQVEDDYDYIIIDTQPTRDSLLLSNAIYAADYVLIPAMCEDNSEESAFRLYTECNKMRKSSTSHLKGVGVMLVNVDKNASTDKKMRTHFKEELGASLFETEIPASRSVKTSISRFVPVCYLAKTQPVAKAYVNAYKELQRRLADAEVN